MGFGLFFFFFDEMIIDNATLSNKSNELVNMLSLTRTGIDPSQVLYK